MPKTIYKHIRGKSDTHFVYHKSFIESSNANIEKMKGKNNKYCMIYHKNSNQPSIHHY